MTCINVLINFSFYSIGSFQSKAILSLLQIIRLRKNNIYQLFIYITLLFTRYWIECIRLQHISLEDDSVYERLRSYGIGEQFIKSEGVIGIVYELDSKNR